VIRPPRWFPAAARLATAVLVASWAGCAGAPEEEERGLEEIGELMAGAEPVQATVVEGSEALETDPFALADPEALGLAPAPEQEEDLPLQQNPYIRFGERIIVRAGIGGLAFITKPYTMPPSKAKRLVDLMDALEPFPRRQRPVVDRAPGAPTPPPLDPGVLEYQILEGWDEEFYSSLAPPPDGKVPGAPTPVVLSDVIVVTATYSLLEQFEEFLDLFAAGGVPQIELEAKIIEVVEVDQLDVGVRGSLLFGGANFVQGFGANLPNLAGGEVPILPGIQGGTEAVLDLGAVQDSLTFDAVIEAIRTWDNVQIDSRPKTVVRAGGVAFIESTTEIPYSEIKSISDIGSFTAATVYKKVGVQLYISPRIIGTKMLALDVHLIGSQQVGSQATFSINNTVIEVPVIAYRTAKTVVYLEPGQTLVIGGLTTQRDRELVNKVPILGDIPLLGLLFRSKFTRAEKQHVLFAISPRILQHSDFETEF
jgi:type II secretory pathway component GspD/PulD (secretin)